MTTAATLLAMRQRAQRQLDGMTVNRDALARDMISLLDSIEAARARAAASRSSAADADNGDTLDDLLGRIFRSR